MKIKWGGLIETINELEGKYESPYLESLVQKLQKIEQCNSIHQMRKIINSFSEYDRNYLNSKVLDDLYSNEYTRTTPKIVWWRGDDRAYKTIARTVPKGRKRKNCTLCNAAKKGHLSVVQFIYEKGFFRIKNEPERAFIYALKNGHFDIVYFLMNKGINFCYGNNKAAYVACKKGYLDFLIYLEQKGVELIDHMFYEALVNGHIETVRYFLKKKIIIRAVEYAIIHSVIRNYIEVLEYLYELPVFTLNKGLRAHPDTIDYNHLLSMHIIQQAISYGNCDILRVIHKKMPIELKQIGNWDIKYMGIVKFLYEEIKMSIEELRKLRYYYGLFELERKLNLSSDYKPYTQHNSFQLVQYVTEKGILEFSNRDFQYYMLYTCDNKEIIDYMKEKKFKFDFTYFHIENGELKYRNYTIPKTTRNILKEFLPNIPPIESEKTEPTDNNDLQGYTPN